MGRSDPARQRLYDDLVMPARMMMVTDPQTGPLGLLKRFPDWVGLRALVGAVAGL